MKDLFRGWWNVAWGRLFRATFFYALMFLGIILIVHGVIVLYKVVVLTSNPTSTSSLKDTP